MWWNDAWRYRTTVTRPTPWRDDAPRPVEAIIDFERLLTEAGIEGAFDPASVRIVAPRPDGVGGEVPFAHRSEYDCEAGRDRPYLAWTARPKKSGTGVYHIYFDTRDRAIAPPDYDAASLPPENLIANPGFENETDGLPAGWTASSPEVVRLGRFAHTTGERSLKIVVDENTPKETEREFSVSQEIDVREYAGRAMVFECDLFAERAAYGAPVSIEIRQFRADGSRILEWAVAPRWLTIELAEGHLVQFRERGIFSHDAATVSVCVRFRCLVKDADTDEPIDGPESFFTIWMDRVVMRPAERWPWPAETHGGFVAGALTDAPLNRAFEFVGRRRLAFNPASEGFLQSGTEDSNPRATHWPLETGTIEFWCRPLWDAEDETERVLFEGVGAWFQPQYRLTKVREGGTCFLKFVVADVEGTTHEVLGPAPFQGGRWRHVAATWDFSKAHLRLFLDGKRIGERGPGEAPWPIKMAGKAGGKENPSVGIYHGEMRSVPLQAFIGGSHDCATDRSAEAAMDEFRVSDVMRYAENFTPSQKEFEPDDATRALFHFENERDGVHGLDDRFVRGHLVCELPHQEETAPLDVRTADSVESRRVLVKPHPKPEVFEANRAPNRLPVKDQGETALDPRFVAYRLRTAERIVRGADDAFVLDVGGDFDPLMQSITFERAEDAGNETVLVPHWCANDNVVPFSARSLGATLARDVKDHARRAFEVLKYMLTTTYYFNADYCETLPTRHRKRVFWTFLKALNIYPHNQCGPLNFTLRKLFLAVGISSNNNLGTHQQFQQAFYLGRWRLFDLAPRVYWLERDDATVAPRETLEDDPYLFLREVTYINSWIRGYPYEPMFGTAERPHNMDFPLRPGEKASVCWHNEGRWFELRAGREPIPLAKIPPTYGNGAIVYMPVPEGDAAALENIAVEQDGEEVVLHAKDPSKTASLTYRARCPYILSGAFVTGAYKAEKGGAATFSLSFDEGKTWTQVWSNGEARGAISASLLDQVTARYEYRLKLELAGGARVTGLRVRTTFVASPLALPGKLSRGNNRIGFVNTPPAVPVKTVCRWVERHKTDLGVSLNALSYAMNGGETHRNLLILSPDGDADLAVTLQGRSFDGEVALEGVPPGWLENSDPQRVVAREDRGAATATFRLKAAGAAPTDIRSFDVVVREGGGERRVPAQALVAESPLVREAEAADDVTGEVAPTDRPDASGGRVMTFGGKGALEFAFSARKGGTHALWLRANWPPSDHDVKLTLSLDDAEPRSLKVTPMTGFTDWTDPAGAHTKMFLAFARGDAYWYRIPDVELTSGDRRLTLGAEEGAAFDALVLLPQDAVMDRAAMNLFQNWNFAPWQNPF